MGLLLGTLLGLVWARWQHRQRDHRDPGGSVTDLGESFALVNELRREITRLRQTTARQQADRAASHAALARIADSLEREAKRLPVPSIGPASGENRAPDA